MMRPMMRPPTGPPRMPASPPVTSRTWTAVWFAWNMPPPATPNRRIAIAKKPVSAAETARGNFLNATGRYLKGPPLTTPSSSISRYFTPSVHSTNFVHIASRPATTIQNAAPGPPIAIAAPTPAMLPMPTVAAVAEVSAWKWVTSPGSFGLE